MHLLVVSFCIAVALCTYDEDDNLPIAELEDGDDNVEFDLNDPEDDDGDAGFALHEPQDDDGDTAFDLNDPPLEHATVFSLFHCFRWSMNMLVFFPFYLVVNK